MIAAHARVAGLFGLLLASVPAAAQTSPPPGVLTLPKSHAPSAPAAPITPPQAAPVAPVQQVAPLQTPMTQPAPAATTPPTTQPKHKKPTPVVRPQTNGHAQRPPPPAKPAAAAPPAADAAPPDAAPPADAKGTVTGLKLPRWASLRSDEVNMRVGPGTRFPIDWQYHRRDLPVRILREVEVWRLVEDQDGVKGWVHQATLVGRRGFVVRDPEAVMRRSASDDAAPVALLKQGVVGRIRACDAGAAWCQVAVSDYNGWLKRAQFWGSDDGEAISN